jgi:ClpX C4-type zinc finger
MRGKGMRKNSPPRCSFCGKAQNEVAKLIHGPSVHICNECVDICIEIITDDAWSKVQQPMSTPAREPDNIPVPGVPCSLCHVLTPANQCLLIPERGQLCPACLEAIRSAIDALDAPSRT